MSENEFVLSAVVKRHLSRNPLIGRSGYTTGTAVAAYTAAGLRATLDAVWSMQMPEPMMATLDENRRICDRAADSRQTASLD